MSDETPHPLVFGVVGSAEAVTNSLSPAMFAAAFSAAGIDAYYAPHAVRPRSAGKALRALPRLGFSGVNVTMPYKDLAAQIAHDRSELVETTGVANTLIIDEGGRIRAEATDGKAVSQAISAAGVDIRGADVALVGAGGAATEAAWACAAAGARSITVWNRTRPRASELIRRLEAAYPQVGLEISARLPIHVPARVLVSAVPAAVWRSQELSHLAPGQLVVDLAYRRDRRPTALIEAAHAARSTVVDGRELLVRQAAEAFRLWFGLEPPIEVMKVAVE